MTHTELTEYLRNVAFSMSDRDIETQEIADILGLRRQTVAAWLAHRTMGKY